MAMLRNQIYILAFLLCMQSVRAGIFSTFRFSDLLYTTYICSHESPFCPPPPCDWVPEHQPPICEHYYCEPVNDGGPPRRQCTFLDDCYKDNSDACIATQKFLGTDGSGSSTSDSNLDYSASDVGGGSGLSSGGNTSVKAHWAAYAILGGILTTFLLVVIWRKRSKIDNDQLGEELQPHGEDLDDAVASKVEAGDYVMS